MIKSILEGVAYIHEMKIKHRDLKPHNILVKDKDDFSSLKLIDFGLGNKKRIDDQKAGTLLYMAPEVLKKKSEYSKSVDMWAIGIMMFEILTGGKHPLYDRTIDDK